MILKKPNKAVWKIALDARTQKSASHQRSIAFREKLIFRFYFLTGAAGGVASPVFKAAPMAGI